MCIRDRLDADATAQAGAEIAARFPVSHVIHNAGVIWPNLLPQVTQEELHGLTQIHLGAAISLVQAALPGMQERKFGRIVMMLSLIHIYCSPPPRRRPATSPSRSNCASPAGC